LVYSATLDSHVAHLEEVFTVLETHQLHVKLSKCTFAQPSVQFLGHIISHQGVSVDPSKV
jgi:hypothetical protein